MMNHNKDPHRCLPGLWRLWAGIVLACTLGLGLTAAHAQSAIRTFDHVKTGFPLSGVHSSQRCENCHVNGIFRGTPRDCQSCHTSGARLAGQNTIKPMQHVQTQLPCDSCHNTVTFTGARFNHMGIAPNSCGTCHNGMTATGKPGGHIPTTASCGTCHRTTAWLPAGKPDHSMFTTATVCSSCHNGSTATGKPGNHIATAGNCIDCHRTTAWLPASKPDHGTFNAGTNCASCHNGSNATGKPGNHMPTSVNCFACHSPTRPAFTPHSWNHTQQPVTNQCATCHTGSYLSGMGKPANHIPYQLIGVAASANCDTCHKSGYTSWFPGRFHANVTVTSQCNTCHSSAAYGLTTKPGNHIPLAQLLNGASMDCSACHRTINWSVTTAQMNHNGSLGKGSGLCIACHATGTNYLGNMQKMTLAHRGASAAAGKTDCSDSGCHRPLGNTGTTYRNWN
ncbi:MAG: cytochrome c3 family protein [Hylemonella sp.]